jgi:hypothetical protein
LTIKIESFLASNRFSFQFIELFPQTTMDWLVENPVLNILSQMAF